MATAADHEHWVDPADADRKGFWIFGHLLLISVAAILVTFVVWADNAVLDIVTRGQGKVIPSSQVQVIQNLEGGIMAGILVHEGDLVDKEQVLMRIENTSAQSNYDDLHSRYLSALATITRLEAEIAGTSADAIVFPEELMADAPELAADERKNASIRHEQLDAQVAVLRDQATQKQQEVDQLSNKIDNLKQSLALAQKQLNIMNSMEEGVVSQVDKLKAQRDAHDLKSELEITQLQLPQAKSAQQEAENRVREQELTFRSEAATELSKQRLEQSSVVQQLKSNKDKVTRTEVRSPVRGTVKEIKIRTIGGVIKPGEDLMEIVPIEDTLLVEAQVRTSDIAFIHVGQSATVKFDTYDYSIYGGLKATVEYISIDAIEDQSSGKKERYFRVRLRTDKNFLGTEKKPLAIGPGYTATAEILTDKKTVLAYLLKPILKARDTAFSER
ncbi:MAG TPA: HlyD family type I secretion periplasmic adaptor subunit [Candidatus Angelobacter sp.]|nr:HlyD family type I secretion periplasmic adaptor subunit [Candidatus Angelobacter sp.]